MNPFVCVGCGEPVSPTGNRTCSCPTGLIMRCAPDRELIVAPDEYRREAAELHKRADELIVKADEVAKRVREVNGANQ